MGVTNLISAGRAKSAMSMSIKPVRIASKPVPSSAKTLVPTSWKAVAYTIAAAGL